MLQLLAVAKSCCSTPGDEKSAVREVGQQQRGTLHVDYLRLQVCKVCQKQFANVYRLQRHMISHDESAVLRRFKCADCGKAFKFKHHLKVSDLMAKIIQPS